MKITVTCLIFLSITSTIMGQTAPPLADDLKAYFPGYIYADGIWPVPDTSNEWITSEVTFNTNAKTVTFDWSFKDAGATVADHIDTVSVGYQPTAICRKAAIGSTLFVAGYAPRSGDVIVERWDITNLALGASAGPGGGTPKSTLGYSIQKTIIYNDATVGPLTDIAYHLPAERLWLFEYGGTNTIWALDPSTSQTTWVADRNVIPALSDMRGIRTMKVDPPAAEPGFIMLFEQWPHWEAAMPGFGDLDILVIRDEDLNGAFTDPDDEIAVIDWTEYHDRQYDEHSDNYYQ